MFDKDKGYEADFWRKDGPLKKDGGGPHQWSEAAGSSSSSSNSSVSQPSESGGGGGNSSSSRQLTRRTGPIKRPVLKALKVEDKENEKPKAEPEEKPVPYRLEKEVLTNVYDLKKDNQPPPSRHSAAPPADKSLQHHQHQHHQQQQQAEEKERYSAPSSRGERQQQHQEPAEEENKENSWETSGKSQAQARDASAAESNREAASAAPRRNNWIFIDEEQAFAGARGAARGRGRGFRDFSARGGGNRGARGENSRGYGSSGNNNNNGGSNGQRGGRGRGPREFVKTEDMQRGKPRRRNVSETLSEASEYEELPKRRRQKATENGDATYQATATGDAKKADRDSWRSNKVYTDEQGAGGDARDKPKPNRGFGRSLPPRLNAGYQRGFGSRDISTWRGRSTQFGSGSTQENGYGLGTDSYSRRPAAEREPVKYAQKFSGSFMENGVDERGGAGGGGADGDGYLDNDNPDNRPLRRRRPPRQDKPPRFRRLREREPSGQWNNDDYVNGDFANPWPGRGKNGGGGDDGWPGHYSSGGNGGGRAHELGVGGGQQGEDWESGSDTSDFSDWREKRGGGGGSGSGQHGDVPSDSGHSEPGSGEKREHSKRSFSSQRPLVERQNRKGEPPILEGGKMSRSSDTPTSVGSANRNDSWQNGVSPTCKRSVKFPYAVSP